MFYPAYKYNIFISFLMPYYKVFAFYKNIYKRHVFLNTAHHCPRFESKVPQPLDWTLLSHGGWFAKWLLYSKWTPRVVDLRQSCRLSPLREVALTHKYTHVQYYSVFYNTQTRLEITMKYINKGLKLVEQKIFVLKKMIFELNACLLRTLADLNWENALTAYIVNRIN